MNKLLQLAVILISSYIIARIGVFSPYIAIGILLLFITLLSPVACISIWLISEIYFGNFQLLGANPRTFVALIAGTAFLVREIVVYKGKNLKNIFKILIFPISLLIMGLIINKYSNANFFEYFRWLITFISNLMVVFLIGLGIKNTDQLKKIINIFAIIILIDCFIGILQYFGVDQAYHIREYLSKFQIYSPASRILGLSRTTIEFSYILLLGFFIFAGHKLIKNIKPNILIQISLVIVGITLIMNATRSAIGGVFLASLFYFSFHSPIFKEKIIKKSLIVLCISFLILIAYFGLKSRENSYVFSQKWLSMSDSSALGRLPRFQLAVSIILDNPLGIGTVNYDKYIYSYWAELPVGRGISLDEFSAHNNFLRTVVEYGYLGGMLLIIFLFNLHRKAMIIYKTAKDEYVKSIAIGIFYFLIAYYFHIFFHNFGPFYGDNLFWFMVGLLVAASNITLIEKKRSEVNV